MGPQEQIYRRLARGLDRRAPEPLYAQLADRVAALIADGTFPAGRLLESEVAMGAQLGLSRPTMRRAIEVLVDRGLLVRRRGVGTQVVHGAITRRAELTSLYDDLVREDRAPTTVILLSEELPATAALAGRLGVAHLERPVLHLRRLRSADGAPIAIMENHLIDPPRFDLEELTHRGLYGLIQERGVRFAVARQSVTTRAASHEEQVLLDLPGGSPILAMRRHAFDHSGRLIERAELVYRPDRYTVEFTMVDRP